GPERPQLESQANRLGLLSSSVIENHQVKTQHTGSVHFSGWLSQAKCAEKLKNADVFVLPSLLECGGAVVLEAMALKLPVIATNWGGPIDYINDSCGILVDPTSEDLFVSGLTHAMISLAKNPEQRITMGEHAYDRVIQLFDWEAKVNSILSIYQDAVTEQSEELVTASS
ncbi:MAG: glycosyltransferase family 4 protein, partial [Cyanobacteria bacterium J06626_14]